jgi:hypothetical protein
MVKFVRFVLRLYWDVSNVTLQLFAIFVTNRTIGLWKRVENVAVLRVLSSKIRYVWRVQLIVLYVLVPRNVLSAMLSSTGYKMGRVLVNVGKVILWCKIVVRVVFWDV